MRALISALWILRDVSLPYSRRHLVRACLTLVGVVIGTHVVVAVQIIGRSVVTSFAHTVETIAGSADLQVTNASAGVPEELVSRVAAVSGVESASALLQGTLATPFGDLALFGVDLFGDQRVREVQFPHQSVRIPDELVFANALDSVAVSRSFLARSGLALDAEIRTTGPLGFSTVTVRGDLDPVGPARLFGGAVAVADLPAAQRLLGREGLVDQIDVKLAPGADPREVAARLAEAVAGAGAVRRPGERAEGLEAMLRNLRTLLMLTSLEAVIVGFFLVYHALRTAILQRRRELAIARALGHRRSTLALATVLEAAGFGAAGALLGGALGVAVARAALGAVSRAVGAIYASPGGSELSLQSQDLALALGLGVATALLAAWGPAREAARLPVIRHLRTTSDLEADRERRQGTSAWLGLGLVALGAGLYTVELRSAGFLAHVALLASAAATMALGFAGLVPLLLRAAPVPLRRLAASRGGPGFALAVGHMSRDVERSRGTIAAIMVAFALVIVTSSMVASLRGSILGWVDQTLAADLYVGPSPRLPLPSGDTFAAALEKELRSVPGIAEVGGSRLAYVQLGGGPAVLRTVPSRLAFGRLRYPVVASAGGDLELELASGRGVLVSDNLAYREGISAGDRIALPTPSGERVFSIAAIVTDFTLDIGTVTVAEEVYREAWEDRLVNVFYVWTEPGASAEAVRAAIRDRLGGRTRVTVLTAGEFKQGVADALDRALHLTYAIELVAVAIAVIAVANFFLVGVADRRREIGLLRAVALGRRQLRRVFLGEAAMIGAAGGVMAVLYALPVSFFMVTRSTRLVSGWRLTFELPVGLAVASVVVAAATAVAAAGLPVRRSARRQVADLVTFE